MSNAPGSAGAPDRRLLFLGLSPDHRMITFHFVPPTPPLTGWHDGSRVHWRWADDAEGPAPVPRDRFGPCEKPLLAVVPDRRGITFQWAGRVAQRYDWHDERGFLPAGENN